MVPPPDPSDRVCVLASGSSGNATLLKVNGRGLLIDCGLNPTVLTERLLAAGEGWDGVAAVLLTHTHGDHWNRYTLAHLRRLNVPLVAHPKHHVTLSTCSDHEPLRRAGLLESYDAGRPVKLLPGLTVTPVAVPHDSDPTFAFRLDGADWSVGYASDLGTTRDDLRGAFAGVTLLAVEYNHDVTMERRSRRPQYLINRVLGDDGHLSNEQAAAFTADVARSGQLRGLVQLHLSRECNRPEIAAAAGRAAVPGVSVVTASQHRVTPWLPLHPAMPMPAMAPLPVVIPRQPSLPGLDPNPAG